MKEIRSILQAFDQALIQNKQMALATVVQVEGSSYRRAGARMLITEDGQMTGAISGGCLEGDALRKALQVIHTAKPAIVIYDTMDDDDATIGLGTGCNGIIHVLLEPLLSQDGYLPIKLLQLTNTSRQPWALLTFFNRQDRHGAHPGTRLLLAADGSSHGLNPYPSLQPLLDNEAREVLRTRSSQWLETSMGNERVTVFIEFLPPAPLLVIAGAGNDVLPLVQMADVLGWDTLVADGRPNYATTTRFGGSCQVLVAKPEQILDQVSLDDYTLFALMTHNYNYDKALLYALCQRQVKYIAMLGPKKKINRILEEYADEGRPLNDDQLGCIYSPAGLDLGAETAEEIALAILAEMRAFLAGRRLNSLRYKLTPIHSMEG